MAGEDWARTAALASAIAVGVGWLLVVVAGIGAQSHRTRAVGWGYSPETGITLRPAVLVCIAAGVGVLGFGWLAVRGNEPRMVGLMVPTALVCLIAGWVVRLRAAQTVTALASLGPPAEPVLAGPRPRRVPRTNPRR